MRGAPEGQKKGLHTLLTGVAVRAGPIYTAFHRNKPTSCDEQPSPGIQKAKNENLSEKSLGGHRHGLTGAALTLATVSSAGVAGVAGAAGRSQLSSHWTSSGRKNAMFMTSIIIENVFNAMNRPIMPCSMRAPPR